MYLYARPMARSFIDKRGGNGCEMSKRNSWPVPAGLWHTLHGLERFQRGGPRERINEVEGAGHDGQGIRLSRD